MIWLSNEIENKSKPNQGKRWETGGGFDQNILGERKSSYQVNDEKKSEALYTLREFEMALGLPRRIQCSVLSERTFWSRVRVWEKGVHIFKFIYGIFELGTGECELWSKFGDWTADVVCLSENLTVGRCQTFLKWGEAFAFRRRSHSTGDAWRFTRFKMRKSTMATGESRTKRLHCRHFPLRCCQLCKEMVGWSHTSSNVDFVREIHLYLLPFLINFF